MSKKMRPLIFLLCALLIVPNYSLAIGNEAAATFGTAGTATVMGLENLYEATVIARMTGRAGASTPSGAKGIAFEILYSDIKNAFSNIKNGYKTSLSKSSIDELADLITTNKKGEIVQLIQCKDGTSISQVDKIIQQIIDGKYEGADIVVTKELAELYEERAQGRGIDRPVVDSKISISKTKKIADKALSITPSSSELLKSTLKNSAVAAAVTSCISIAESVYRGDDVYEMTGNVVEDTTISAATVALATVTSAELPALLTSLGASATIANTAAAVVAIFVPVAGGYALYVLADEYQFDEKVEDIMGKIVEHISNTYHSVEAKVIEFDIPGKVSNAKDNVASAANDVKTRIGNWKLFERFKFKRP